MTTRFGSGGFQTRPGKRDRRFRPRLRLDEYDYGTPGAYFFSTRISHTAPRLGCMRNGQMQLNQYGRIVDEVWKQLPTHYGGLRLDAWQVMPDHVHCILWLGSDEAGLKPAAAGGRRSHGVTELIRALKTFSARRINELRGITAVAVWQENPRRLALNR